MSAGEVFAGAAAAAAVGSAVVAAVAAWWARRSSTEAVASTDVNAALGRAMTRYVAAIADWASTDERVALVGHNELELIAADPSAGEFRDAARRILAAKLVNASQRAGELEPGVSGRVVASEAAKVTDAAGVAVVCPVLVRLARAEVERHRREGTEAPLGIVKIAQARSISGHATARRAATGKLS